MYLDGTARKWGKKEGPTAQILWQKRDYVPYS
jgi:hypothetical protein